MVVCEVATLPMKAGLDFSDKSSSAGKVWDDIYRLISSQDGFQSCHYGPEVESPNITQLFINWGSIDDHKKFMESNSYPAMLKDLESVMDGAPDLYHFTPTVGNQTAAFSAPVNEIVTFYLPLDDTTFGPNMEKFCDILLKHGEGMVGVVGGYSVEEVEHEKLEGKKGKKFLGAIGWQSVEAHMAYRETDAFKDNIQLLRTGPVAIEMHHTKLQQA